MQLKKVFLFLALLGFLVNPVTAQDTIFARKIVDQLSSPAFKGRGYAHQGDQKASAFIAESFRKNGLMPLSAGSYFQEFKLPVNIFPGKVVVSLNDQLLQTGKDYLIDAASPAIHGTFSVLFIKRSDLKLKEIPLLGNAKEAFLLLDLRPAIGENPAETKELNQKLQTLLEDTNLSCRGFLILSNDKLTWTTAGQQDAKVKISINKKGLDPGIIKTVRLNIDAQFLPDYKTRNVVGIIKGSSDSDSTLVLTAHYDHLGMMGSSVYFPGANDNASGVAMLLSFARYYAQHKPKYNTIFIAFSGEEIGLMGSKYFVEQPLTDLHKIKFLLNFDLAGTGEEGIRVVNGAIFKDQFNELLRLNQDFKLLPKIDIRGAACNSDHCRFYVLGVPCFFIYTQGGIQAYHDIYDRPETLPLTAFSNYFTLMQKFLDTL